jgi:hypothetical protein
MTRLIAIVELMRLYSKAEPRVVVDEDVTV